MHMARWAARTNDVRDWGHLQGGSDDDEQIDLCAILKQRPVELIAEFLAEESNIWLCVAITSSAASRTTRFR